MPDNEFFYFSGSSAIESIDSAEAAIAKTQGGGFAWLSFIDPAAEELNSLIDLLKIHPLSIEDCFDDQQIPKIDNFPDYTHVLFNTFGYADKILKIDEVNLFLGENFIVSVRHGKNAAQNGLGDLRRMVENEIEEANEGPSYVMHVILDNIVDQKLAALETIEDELIELEDTMLESLQDFEPSELQRIRRVLLRLRKSLFHEREILVKITRKDSRFIPDKAIFHYSDIYDHLNKFVELTESNREILASMSQMNLSLLNNRMSRSSNQTNKSVRRLTFITTIFMPLTLLTGIGGMSEYSMMTGASNWRISYPVFLAVMALIGIANYAVLKWMGRNDKDLD